MSKLVDKIVTTFTERGLAAPGFDQRPWSRYFPAIQFAQAAVSAIEADYEPTEDEVSAACGAFFGQSEVLGWQSADHLEDEEVAEQRRWMREALIAAHQARSFS